MKNGMTLIVKVIARIASPLIIVFGIYMILHGHLSPGGGFPGGVVIASAFVLLTLSFGKEIAYQKLKKSSATAAESVGALIFLILAILGIFFGGWFFLNFLPKGEPLRLLSAGFIPLCNIGIGLKVGGGIFAVFLTLILFRLLEKGEGE
jgi:multicomponent Na+:H+ antiporter subunit B